MGREIVASIELIFQSCGYALTYIKMHNISLLLLCTCLWMLVHNVVYNWLISLQLPDLHMQLLISVQ